MFLHVTAGYNDIIQVAEDPWYPLHDLIHGWLPDGWRQSHTIRKTLVLVQTTGCVKAWSAPQPPFVSKHDAGQ